jgi:hypothetical protein
MSPDTPIFIIPAASNGRIEIINAVTSERASVATAADQPVNVYYRKADTPQPPKPPTSDWPKFAYTPDKYDEVIEVTSGLRQRLESLDTMALIILDDSAIDELNVLTQQDPALLVNCIFTPRPTEFGVHPLTVNLGGDAGSGGPSFQGFRMVPSSNGYHARHYGKGFYEYRLCTFEGGYKGITTTGSEADAAIYARYCDFSGMRGYQCAGIYHVRGGGHAHECTFSNIGHAPGEPRPSYALLNHDIYCQWDTRFTVRDCFMRTTDSHAVQLRGGGTIDGILATRTANGVLFGHDKTDRPIVTGTLKRAIIANTEDIDPGSHNTGVGVWAERANVTVYNSIIADEASVGDGAVFRPQNDSKITLGDGVRVRGITRTVDVDGHRTTMTGTILQAQVPTINARKDYSKAGINIVRGDQPAIVLPDLDTMPTPKPGTIGTLIDSILAGGTQ